MLINIGKQSGEFVESIRKKKRKASVARICRISNCYATYVVSRLWCRASCWSLSWWQVPHHQSPCCGRIACLEWRRAFWKLFRRSSVSLDRTGQGPCRANLHKQGLAQSPSCDCGQRQTTLSTRARWQNLKADWIHSMKWTMTQSRGWNLQQLQHSRNNKLGTEC